MIDGVYDPVLLGLLGCSQHRSCFRDQRSRPSLDNFRDLWLICFAFRDASGSAERAEPTCW